MLRTKYLVEMKKGRPRQEITEKELVIMKMLWAHGPLFVREMVALYDEPRPHFNTVSTLVRILEQKGHVAHEVVGGNHRFDALTRQDEVCRRRFGEMVKDYFSNSYKQMVSALVADEKISADELREILELIEKNTDSKQ